MQLRIPPTAGGGLPVGEIVLFLSLMTINYTSVLGRLSRPSSRSCHSASGGALESHVRCSISASMACGPCAMPHMS
jgi:hypothetical protein